jgi:murein DD-endopeptidase MepM/ murein hydrolase activator NlpD
MQFLSTTWARWGRLAPGRPANAVASAHNAWDAIYSAADYLCNGGAITDLGKAVLRYNPSDDYVASVLSKAREYGWGTSHGPGQLAWPVHGPIASPFGPRADPITGAAGFHPGIDIGVSQGTPIHAPADGTVTQAEYDGGCGNAITIDHGDNLQTRYCHLSVIGVTRGQHVVLGQVVGEVGSTGNSTGPHLHFEVHDQGALCDPLDYLARQ